MTTSTNGSSTRWRGHVKRLKSHREGWGFIARDDGGEDVFLHKSDMRDAEAWSGVAEGARVEFDVMPGKNDRPRAHDVVVLA